MILSDRDIKEYAIDFEMIHPFDDKLIKTNEEGKRIPSKGLSTCGYDVVLAPEWKIAKPTDDVRDILDADKEDWYEYQTGPSIVIPSKGFVLARTEEYFRMPDYICGSLFCKSTLARCGLILPPTWTEPGWEGNLVVEIYNANPFPMRIHSGMGIGQMIFFKLLSLPGSTYDHTRKYQGQTGITIAKI